MRQFIIKLYKLSLNIFKTNAEQIQFEITQKFELNLNKLYKH